LTQNVVEFTAAGSRRLRVGLIGCGAIAQPHVSTLVNECGPIELHLCDVRLEAAETLAAGAGGGVDATYHSDAAAMIAGAGLEVVHVLTPPDSHFDLGLQAVAAGSHALIEKPLAMTVSENEQLFAAGAEADRVVCVDHSTLFMPCVLDALAVINSGSVGRPIAVNSFFGHAEKGHRIPYGNPEHWAYKIHNGVLLNLISHPASLLVDVLGPPTRIDASTASGNLMPGGQPDGVQVAIQTPDGFGTMVVSMGHDNHLRQATVWCEGGTILMDLTRQTTVVSRHRGPIGLVPKMVGGITLGASQVTKTLGVGYGVATKKVKREPGIRGLVEAFYAALRSGGPPPVSAESTLGVARIQEAALGVPATNGAA
jgi:predicted dehydrogenase